MSEYKLQCRNSLSQQMVSKKTCCHIIWCLMSIYDLDKNDPRLAQVEFANNVFYGLVLKTPSEIPQNLKILSSIKARVFCKQLEAHDKSNHSKQERFLTRKTMGKSARFSGCLKPGAIKMTDLYLRVKGLLFLERNSRVVETNLRFCLNKSCCLNIESSRNNMQPLKSIVIKKDPLLGTLSQEEIITVQLEGFKIQGMPNVKL